MLCLGIETSCDETAVALLKQRPNGSISILAEEISSQIDIHKAYGGIVPELAAREHLRNLPLITELVLQQGGCELKDVNVIAVTRGPGLKGCLLMGTNFARGLSLRLSIPVIGINHIEAHVFSAFLENPEIAFPFLSMVVSGGHTEIIQVNGLGDYVPLVRTLDDAAGEAFDKTANLLGIPYPGGPKLAALADNVIASRFKLPKVMREAEGFSFSGLKTAMMLLVKDNKEAIQKDENIKCEIAHAVQSAIVESLIYKLDKVINETGIKTLVVAGGVSANKNLRAKLQAKKDLTIYFPSLLHCTDNAAMIAYLGILKYESDVNYGKDLSIRARWAVEET